MKFNLMKKSAIALIVSISFSVSSQQQTINAMESVVITSAELASTEKQLTDYFNKMSALDVAKARAWGLTNKDWGRYKKLMATTGREILSPKIDPITLLGVEARTESERIRYAKLFNQFETSRTVKEIAFASAQAADLKRMNPLSGAFVSYTEQRNDRKEAFFKDEPIQPSRGIFHQVYIDLRIACDESCNKKIIALNGMKKVDFYFINAISDDDIFVFARSNSIDSKKVQDGDFTLNYADSTSPEFKGAIHGLINHDGKPAREIKW